VFRRGNCFRQILGRGRGRPVAQGNIARQRVERSQKGQRVAALERFYFVFVFVFVSFILLCFIVLILYSICYFKNGVPAGGIEASASGGGWSPCACCERDGRRLGQKLNAIRSEANPHARRTGLAWADFGHDGMFMPLGEGCRESVWSGLVWSGLVLVWEAGVGADICCPVAAWLHEPTHPSSEACKKELKLRATVAPTVLQASRVEDDFSGSQQSRPRVTLHSLARCTARRFLAEGGGVGLPRPSSFPPGSPLWSGLLQASGSDWLPFDAGEGPRRPRGFFLA
jgi:hypothetical protein